MKVEAPGAHVRARAGFYVPGAAEDTPEVRQRQMVDALRSPMEFTGVRLNVRELQAVAGTKPSVEGKSIHQFEVGVAGDSVSVDEQNGNKVDLTLVAMAFLANGKNGGCTELHVLTKLEPERLAKVRRSGLAVNPLLPLAPGKYDICFAVRDNLSGEIGTVEYPIEVK